MKRSSLLLLAIFSIVAFAFTSCDKLSDPISSEEQGLFTTVSIPDESEMAVPSTYYECSIENPANLMEPKDDPFYPERPIKFMTPLGRILRELNLDSLQIEQVKSFLAEYRDCVKNALQTLRESERLIIQAANQERRQVLDDLKNGIIDRQEAFRRLMQINQETRNALINNPVRQQVLQQLKDCFTTLIDNIRNILTSNQKALFDELIQKYRDKRNGGTGPGTRP
ncbi:MAG: hypothetical protein ACUVQ1_08040 [Candidatus Kapaibacteriales bacterium]